MRKALGRNVLICFFYMAAPFAMAGQSGNGGDVVVCIADGRIRSVELLDFYEAKTLRKIQYSLGDKILSVEAKIELALSRLSPFSPVRVQDYLTQTRSFYSEALFLKGVKLDDIPDAGYLALPIGCHIEQIVIQKEPRFPGDPRFLVSQDLWDFLDNDSRAGLILHEVIYREAISYGHTDSIATRYFNSLIFGNKIKDLTMQTFLERLLLLPFPRTNLYGMQVMLATCESPLNGKWKCEKKDWPNFYSSGNVESVDQGPVELDIYKGVTIGRYKFSTRVTTPIQRIDRHYYDTPEGKIKSLRLWIGGNELFANDGNTEFKVATDGWGYIHFDEQGYIKN